MAIHWKIPFKTLHSETLLTVNVYDTDYSGEAVVLKGAAQPFETQEDTSDDIFTPVHKQSGYLRIVDDGFAADGVTAFNWRDFIPTTDTDRPVTLTDANDNVLWQGFMQAQNFGAMLFGNPQNREFPVQCSLSVTQGIDINYDQKQLRNFAYLLWKVLDSIPTPCKPQTIVVQGDAVACLSKIIDWRNFVDLDNDNQPEAKHKMYECLEEMCKFWGWTARTHARTLYLVSPDDNSIDTLASFPYTDLVTLAAGVDITPTVSDYSSVTIDGGFANADSKDYQMRGASKATFTPSPNTADTNIVDVFDHQLENEMDEQGWTYGGTLIYDGNYYAKTGDVLSMERLDLIAEASNSGASFNRMKKQNVQEGGYMESFNVIMFRKSYDSGTLYLQMQTKYMHSFSDGFFRMLADTYLGPDKWQEGNFFAGNKDMVMRMGIGTSRNNAKWWNGHEWVSSVTTFRATLGNQKPELFSRYREGSSLNTEETSIISTGTTYGYLFLDFLGSDNIPEYDGQRQFNLKDFRIEFRKNNTVVKTQYPNSGWYEITDKELKETVYKSTNGNAIEDEVTIDTIFASEKTMKPGFGVVLNTDGSYFTGTAYGGTDVEHPEQHLADRITDYWATSKRKIEAHLLTHDNTAATPASNITPAHMATIDGTTLYPVAISRKWRDEEIDVVAMEMVTRENLPYDAQVEYLRGDGTAYIDTGIYGTPDLRTELVFQLRATSASKALFGSYSNASGYYLYLSAGTPKWQTGFGIHGNSSSSADTNQHTIVYNDYKVELDGTQLAEYSTAFTTTPHTLLLFNMAKTDGTLYSGVSMDIMSCKLIKNGVTVRDFIPVRKDGIGYMYDKVSGELFGNENSSGAFTYGNDTTPQS